ncbi:MAG: hypothetical protein KAU22_04020, partial [Desulfuromonadales bacterium]|nr:hypothetical protein [Desulfuromonadales bacterium]
LLLQVVFMAQMFSEQNKFGLAEVAESISNKLIRRHPHVFGNANADDHAVRWQKIKQQERAAKGKGNKLADRIPANLPALKKAAKVAKSLDNNLQTIEVDKIHDILRQLSLVTADPIGSKNDLDKLFGNLLFGVVQLGNSLQLDAEDLLRKKTIEVIAEIDN